MYRKRINLVIKIYLLYIFLFALFFFIFSLRFSLGGTAGLISSYLLGFPIGYLKKKREDVKKFLESIGFYISTTGSALLPLLIIINVLLHFLDIDRIVIIMFILSVINCLINIHLYFIYKKTSKE